MQTHPGRTALLFADAADAWMAHGARSLLHARAAWARLAHGQAPISWIAGPATLHTVVADGKLARLLHYAPQGQSERRGAPVLVVASLINRYYVLDLLPELSFIAGLVARGLDVYVLDWKAPGAAGPDLRFADYVDGAIPEAARTAAARHGAKNVLVLGYCMGGTMSALLAARHPELVRGLTVLGAPIDFHASGMFADWTRRERFDADLLIDAYGNMPPSLLQSGFQLLNPVDAIAKNVHFFNAGGDERRLRHMVALQAWLEDNIAFPGGVYREYIGRLYQDNALVRGELQVGGTPVDLRRITMPVLDVVALRDHICAPPAARALLDHVSSEDKRLLEFDTGHIGLTTSTRSQKELWPVIADWFVAHAHA